MLHKLEDVRDWSDRISLEEHTWTNFEDIIISYNHNNLIHLIFIHSRRKSTNEILLLVKKQTPTDLQSTD